MTPELKSNMPAFEEIQAEYTMRMVQVCLDNVKRTIQSLNMDIVTPDETRCISAVVYEIDDPTLAGFCPAKVWSINDQITVLFYATEAVPPSNRAFGKGSTYVATFQVLPGEVVEYHVDTKVSIQQVLSAGGHSMIYTVSFGQSEYDVIVKQTEED